jgi:hypothetical protein
VFLEHYIAVTAEQVASYILKPEGPQSGVRVHTDGFVTLLDRQDLFAAIDGWGGYFDSESELEQLAYILNEKLHTEVTEDGVDRFLVVEFGRIRTFLRSPETTDAPVFLYANGMLTLAPEDIPFAQMSQWEEDDVWKLRQFADRWDVAVLVRDTPPDEAALEFLPPEEDLGDAPEFW